MGTAVQPEFSYNGTLPAFGGESFSARLGPGTRATHGAGYTGPFKRNNCSHKRPIGPRATPNVVEGVRRVLHLRDPPGGSSRTAYDPCFLTVLTTFFYLCPTADHEIGVSHTPSFSCMSMMPPDSAPGSPSEHVSVASPADLRTAAKGGMFQFAGMGLHRLANLLFVAIAVRLLGPATFGLYREVAQIFMTAGNMATMGFDTAALRSIAIARTADDSGSVRRAIRIAAIAATIFSMAGLAALLIFADPLAGAFSEDPTQRAQTAFLIRLGAPFVPLFALMTIVRAATRGYKTVVPAVVVGNIVQPFALLAGSTLAIMLGFGVTGAVGGLVASSVVGLLAAVWFHRRLATPGEGRARQRISVRSMTSFALPRAGERLFAISGLGVILLGLWGGNRDVALFAVAGSLQSLVLVFPEALMGIWQPMIADLQQRGEAARLESLYKTINRWVASASLWLAAALLILPEPFVHVLGGSAVADASIVTAVLALGTLINVATGPSGMLITMAGYPAVNLLNSMFATTAYVLLAWKLVPAHGVLGMAVIQTLVVGLLNIARVIEARILVGILPFGRSFAKPALATMALGGVLVGWRLFFERGLWADTAGIGLAGLIYAAVLGVMGIDPEDRLVYDRLKERLAGLVPRRGRSA